MPGAAFASSRLLAAKPPAWFWYQFAARHRPAEHPRSAEMPRLPGLPAKRGTATPRREGCFRPGGRRPRPSSAHSPSCVHHLEIAAAPGSAERQNLGLRPTLGRGQSVDIEQQPLRLALHLGPQEARQIEILLAAATADRADEAEQYLGDRIRLGHAFAYGIPLLLGPGFGPCPGLGPGFDWLPGWGLERWPDPALLQQLDRCRTG